MWSSIQHPNWLQRVVAGVLGMPLSKVRIFAPDPGGGFGGKQHAKYEPLVAFMALRAGRPVRLVLTLEETFQAVRRGASEIRVRTGFRRDGTLVFRDVEADYLIGAYADIADRTVAKGSYTSGGPYMTPAMRIVARSVLSHTDAVDRVPWLRQSAADLGGRVEHGRGVASPRHRPARAPPAEPGQAPAMRSSPATGPPTATGPRPSAARPSSSGGGRRRRRAAGRGIAVGLKSGPTTGLSYATVRLLADGSVIVYAGTSDMGQGARTIFAQIAAQELGAPLDWVTVVMGDTAVVPYDQQTSASRSSVLMGNGRAERLPGGPGQAPGDGGPARGSRRGRHRGRPRRGPDRRARAARSGDVLIRGLAPLGGEVIGIGEMRKEAEPGHPLGGTAAFFEFNCTAVEVEVDRATGDVAVTRHVTVSDVGKALHPGQVRGQDEGAAVMALGHTFMEQILLDDEGRIRNLGAIDYRIPTSMDLPHSMESAIVENEDGPGPYGVEGHERGRAPERRAGRGRRRPRCDRRRHPGPAAEPGARLARPARRRGDQPRAVTFAYAVDEPLGLSEADARALLGGKAANLAVMSRDLGLPVPPGLRHHDRDVPPVPRGRLAGRPRRRAARADARPRGRCSVGASVTRPTRCSSASAPERPCRCPG